MRVRAFAKINLSLRVLGIRADGYHELRTIFQSIALHDTLTVRASRGPFRLTCDDPACPDDESNLIWRAAHLVWRGAKRAGAPRDVAIHLEKRIPMQAGLGGGSSDAAAALRALGRLWKVDAARVRAVGTEIGADVPYFFEGGTVLGLERGDLLFPLVDAKPAWVLIAQPDFGVSTKEAFGWWDAAHSAAPAEGRGSRTPQAAPAEPGNDLEPLVAAHYPQVRRLVASLRKAGASQAAMSGSGSAIFGLFASQMAASRAERALASPTLRTMVARTLNRSQYQRLAGM